MCVHETNGRRSSRAGLHACMRCGPQATSRRHAWPAASSTRRTMSTHTQASAGSIQIHSERIRSLLAPAASRKWASHVAPVPQQALRHAAPPAHYRSNGPEQRQRPAGGQSVGRAMTATRGRRPPVAHTVSRRQHAACQRRTQSVGSVQWRGVVPTLLGLRSECIWTCASESSQPPREINVWPNKACLQKVVFRGRVESITWKPLFFECSSRQRRLALINSGATATFWRI